MAELKTKRNRKSVKKFLAGVEHGGRRKDAQEVCAIMEEVTGLKPEMWGDSMVGFGSYTYEYASGRGGEWFVSGFSPRKTSLTVYIMAGFKPFGDLLEKLGKHKTSRGCLYINRLDQIDKRVLRTLIRKSVALMKKNDKKKC